MGYIKGLERYVRSEIGSFTEEEFQEAYSDAQMKYQAIKEKGQNYGLWYLAVLVSEAIRQNRFTKCCLCHYKIIKAACVGERV